MAEGTTSSFNPETGERRQTRFQYEPVQPDRWDGPSPEAIANAYRNMKAAEAEKAVAAAIQYQAGRAYRKALDEGKSVSDAVARFGPEMFRKNPIAISSIINATKPATTKPDYKWVAGSNGIPGRFEAPGQRPVFAPSRSSLSMQFDDQGRPIINYGPQGTGVGDPTVATQSGVQRRLLKYEGAMQLLNDLQRTIQPEFLGAKGAIGEIMVDRGLAQLAPEMANQKRVDFRAGLIAAREALLREISDDSRFSNVDRDEISKALPSSGVFESMPAAQQRIATVRRIISQRGRVYSGGIGLTPPLWSLSKDEIKSLYEKHKATGGKEGIDLKTAQDALERFH